MKFYDIDNGNKVLTIHRMTLRKERGKNKYEAFAILPGFNQEVPENSEINDAFWEPWEVNEDLFDCIFGPITMMCRRITSGHMILGRDVRVIMSRILNS